MKTATISMEQDEVKGTFKLKFTSSGTVSAMSACEAYGLFTIWLTQKVTKDVKGKPKKKGAI